MTTLRKVFDGTNIPALVHKIMSGAIPPLPSSVSAELRELVLSMLQQVRLVLWHVVAGHAAQDPAKRPSTEELLETPLLRRTEAFSRNESDVSTADAEAEVASVEVPPISMPSQH